MIDYPARMSDAVTSVWGFIGKALPWRRQFPHSFVPLRVATAAQPTSCSAACMLSCAAWRGAELQSA